MGLKYIFAVNINVILYEKVNQVDSCNLVVLSVYTEFVCR